jgi:hypothetical protein
VLRHQGGYLWKIVRSLTDIADPPRPIPGATVTPESGPNAGQEVVLAPGIREPFRDLTYLTFTVVAGFPVGVDNAVLREVSDQDVTRLKDLLDTQPDSVTPAVLAGRVQEVATAVQTLISKRGMSELAARRVIRDQGFRRSTEYVLFWISRLDTQDHSSDSAAARDANALNASIFSTLSDLIINLPYMNPGNPKDLAKLKQLTAAHFKASDKNERGLFELNDEGLKQLAATP